MPFADAGDHGDTGIILTASLWAWGEVLLHPRLEQILQEARQHDVITMLSTNGQCLDQDRVLDALIEQPTDCLILAFDGSRDDTKSKYRVGTEVPPILEGVTKLAELKRARGLCKPVLNVPYIVVKHNHHELARLDEFARRHGFELLTIRNMFLIETTCDGETAGRLTPDAEVWRTCGCAHGGDTPRGGFIRMDRPIPDFNVEARYIRRPAGM